MSDTLTPGTYVDIPMFADIGIDAVSKQIREGFRKLFTDRQRGYELGLKIGTDEARAPEGDELASQDWCEGLWQGVRDKAKQDIAEFETAEVK